MTLPKGGKCQQGCYDQELSGTDLGRARGPSRSHLEPKTHTHTFVALQTDILPGGILLVANLVSTLLYAIHSQKRGSRKSVQSQLAGSPKSYGMHNLRPCTNHAYCDALKSSQFYLVIIIINPQTQLSQLILRIVTRSNAPRLFCLFKSYIKISLIFLGIS